MRDLREAKANAERPVGARSPRQQLERGGRLQVRVEVLGRDAVHTRVRATAQIVQMNRSGGPEGVIDAVEERTPDGFTDIDAVLSYEERKAIVRGYAATAGFAREQVNAPPAAAAAGR